MNTQYKITALKHGIFLIDSEYLSGDVAAIYLMIEGNECAIIETGSSHSLPAIQSALAQNNLGFEQVKYIIPTHVHLDHAGGAGALMEQCPNAQCVVHPYGARHLIDPSKLIMGTQAVYGEEQFKTLYSEVKPIPEERVIEAPDELQLKLGQRTLTFLDTPGHAKHHFCIHDDKSNGIFTGDTFGVSYPELSCESHKEVSSFIFATTTPVQLDPDALLNSIDRLMSLQPYTMYLTHFGPVTPTEATVNQLKQSINRFTGIAKNALAITENRITHIEQQFQEFILRSLRENECPIAEERVIEITRNDMHLNAMGYDLWLKRNFG